MDTGERKNSGAEERSSLGMRVAVDRSVFRRNASGEQQIVHGDEGVARLAELVHHLEGGVYAFGKNIVHQNDVASRILEMRVK